MKSYLETFENAARRAGPVLKESQLEAVVGTWLDAAVLKVQKREWANEAPGARSSRSGIFFSIWVEDGGVQKNRAFYNIHALRLRSLKAYSLQSREFATAFRSEFAAQAAGWPNVTTDYGPQTLMQGWIKLDDPHFEEAVSNLVSRFIPVALIIDALLDRRSKA